MILVDSSVWIHYFNGADTPEANRLDGLLGSELLGLGDLILTEVLQGFRDNKVYAQYSPRTSKKWSQNRFPS